MHKFVTLLAALSFVFLATFGFMAMDRFQTGGVGCLASSGYGGLCAMNNSLAVALFHINFLKSFSQVVVPILVIVLLVILGFAIISLIDSVFGFTFAKNKTLFSIFSKPFLPLSYRFLDWSAVLRENIAA